MYQTSLQPAAHVRLYREVERIRARQREFREAADASTRHDPRWASVL